VNLRVEQRYEERIRPRYGKGRKGSAKIFFPRVGIMQQVPELSEKQIQDTALEMLRVHPKVAWVHRMNVGAVKRGSRYIRFGKPGMFDITGQLCDGRRLEIEMKRKGQKLRPEQQEYMDLVNRSGGLAFMATSCIDILEALARV
jgi:VRR-NUC domain.